MSKGQLAADYGNLYACMNVFGLYLFGKLCAVGLRSGLPQLPYLAVATIQLAALALVFALPASAWRDPTLMGEAEGDGEASCIKAK